MLRCLSVLFRSFEDYWLEPCPITLSVVHIAPSPRSLPSWMVENLLYRRGLELWSSGCSGILWQIWVKEGICGAETSFLMNPGYELSSRITRQPSAMAYGSDPRRTQKISAISLNWLKRNEERELRESWSCWTWTFISDCTVYAKNVSRHECSTRLSRRKNFLEDCHQWWGWNLGLKGNNAVQASLKATGKSKNLWPA